MQFLRVNDSVTVSKDSIWKMYVIQEASYYSIVVDCGEYKYALDKMFPSLETAQQEINDISLRLDRGDDELSAYETWELVSELMQRNGVSEIVVDADEKRRLKIIGPADVLVIEDVT